MVTNSGTVILAAGRSTRMGRPKLLLPWGRTSVLGHLIALWRTLGSGQIAVVAAADDRAVAGELDRLGFPETDRIFNATPERGMFSSIQQAARWPGWQEGLRRWALVLGDQPQLRLSTLRGLLAFAAEHPQCVCQPGRAGRPRHPVLLPKTVFCELAQTPAPDLKRFLAGQKARLWQCDDPGLDVDLDRPEDYQRALESTFGKASPEVRPSA